MFFSDFLVLSWPSRKSSSSSPASSRLAAMAALCFVICARKALETLPYRNIVLQVFPCTSLPVTAVQNKSQISPLTQVTNHKLSFQLQCHALKAETCLDCGQVHV